MERVLGETIMITARQIQKDIHDATEEWLQEDEFIEIACKDSLDLIHTVQHLENKYEATIPSQGTLTPEKIAGILNHQLNNK